MSEENNNEPIISPDEEMIMPEGSFNSQSAEPEKSSMLGPILGVLIVVLILILGGLYLWGATLQNEPASPVAERPTAEQNNEPESSNAEADTQALETVSTSDELAAIEADVESTNLDELDAELNAIDAELDSAL